MAKALPDEAAACIQLEKMHRRLEKSFNYFFSSWVDFTLW